QLPHPPVVIGGNGEKVLDRVLRYGGAWAPQHRHGHVIERLPAVRQRAEKHIPVTVFGVPPEAAALAKYQEAGVDRVVRWLPAAQRGPVERELEAFEDAVRELH